MNELELIVSLFPIVFMLHEFEEIIGFKTWVIKDGLWIAKKYPKVAKEEFYKLKYCSTVVYMVPRA